MDLKHYAEDEKSSIYSMPAVWIIRLAEARSMRHSPTNPGGLSPDTVLDEEGGGKAGRHFQTFRYWGNPSANRKAPHAVAYAQYHTQGREMRQDHFGVASMRR